VPITVVQEAVRLKREAEKAAKKQSGSFLNYDEIWCVFDIDDHQKIPQALDQAKANGISVARSNSCFELFCFQCKVGSS